MKKISFVLVAMILVISGCASTTPAVKKETKTETTTEQKIKIDQTQTPTITTNNPVENNNPVAETKISIKTPAVETIKEFNLTAKRFEFSPSTITASKGDKVKITINSLDVNHGFTIAEYNIHETIEPGKQTVVEFTADQVGTFSFYCSVFCGSGHSAMKGSLIVK